MAFKTTGKTKRYFLVGLVIYVLGVGSYDVWSNRQAKTDIMADIDSRLLLAAKSLKYMLSPDFHDRATDETSISFEEELKNREIISNFAFETEFEWLYTLTEKNGKYYFSAPTVTEAEAKERKRWYFLPYDDIPDEFIKAHKDNQTVFATYKDQWGTFRSAAIPQMSPGGRRYIACADFDISYVEELLSKNLWKSILTALFFLGLTIPFILSFRAHCAKLRKTNEELTKHKDCLEQMVEERTLGLKNAKENAEELVVSLEKALGDVKLLSGLLPICASCKKIRDDKGYWKQIELYIRQHSEAEFSHFICPECVKKLYPNSDIND